MRFFLILLHAVKALLRRPVLDRELREEFELHIAQEVQQLTDGGLSFEEASQEARRRMGSIALFEDECRDQRPTAWLHEFVSDLRHGFTVIRQAPIFSVSVVLILAVALAANTFVFAFVRTVLMRSLTVAQAEQLVSINWGHAPNSSYPNYVDLRDRNHSFSELAALRVDIVNASMRARENDLLWGYEVTGNYFAMLGLRAQVGRLVREQDDDAPGKHPVVVISDRYWRTHFGGRSDVLGKLLKLNGYEFTVIGVGPQRFAGSELLLLCDFWVPMSDELLLEPGNDWYHQRFASNVWVMGRLKPLVTRQQAQADLNGIVQLLARTYPSIIDSRAAIHLSVPGLIGDTLRSPLNAIGSVLTAVAALVLLLACTHVSAMLLARLTDREQEVATRLALGAGAFRLLRQLLTENLVLAASAGGVGLGLATLACRAFSSLRPELGMPLNNRLQPDLLVFGLSAFVALSTPLLFATIPALRATRADLMASFRSDSRSRRTSRGLAFRDILTIAQIAISVLLVICSALVVRSLQNALTVKLGYVPERAASVSFDLRVKGYSPEQSRRFAKSLLRELAATPGIEAAGLTSNMPLRVDHGGNNVFSRVDRPVPPPSERRGATVYNITPGFMRAMATHLIAGRDFDDRDDSHGVPVVIVNEEVVRLLFPGQDALGKRIRLSIDPQDKGVEIVGVTETGKYEYLGEAPRPAIYLPVEQSGLAWATVVARGPASTQAMLQGLRRCVLDLNPELALTQAESLVSQLTLPLFPARVLASLLGSFGGLAVVLAAAGLFGTMTYAVARRQREIAIRMALGARSPQVLTALFWRVGLLCALGILLGTGISLLCGPALASVLYGISPRDLTAYTEALLLVPGVCFLACVYPSMRAVSVHPMRILRA